MTLQLIIFDADGTLRRTLVAGQPCPHAPHEWELRERVAERVSVLPAGLRLGVASNQDHVGYGLLGYATCQGLLVAALEAASGRRAEPEAVRFCPHELEIDCACRKPAPGMLLDLLAHYRVQPAHALFIGNEPVDAEAAARAGIAFEWAQALFGADGGPWQAVLRRVSV